MKKIKKLFSVLLALAMVLGMSVTSFAEEDKILGNADDKGTIKISGIAAEPTSENFSVKAYRIVEPVYENGAFKGEYKAVDALKDKTGFQNLTYTEEEVTIDGETVEIEKLNVTSEMMNTALAEIDNLGDGVTMNAVSDLYQAEVEVGTYLVVVTGSETKIYNNMVVSVYYGRDSITGDTLTLGENTTAKMSDHPAPSKEITSVTRPNAEKPSEKTTSANIGDTIKYSVEINPLPNYSGTNPKLELKDTLSKGLTLVETHNGNTLESGIAIEIQDASTSTAVQNGTLMLGTDFTATLSDAEGTDGAKELLINFVVNGEYTLKRFFDNKETTPALKAVITYSAVLNDSAAMNQDDNTNGVVLTYTKDSKVDGKDGETTEEKKTHTYTFDIGGSLTGNIFTKTGEGEDENGLGGAEFTVYTDAACTTVYTNKGIVDADNQVTFNGTVTSDTNGNLYIRGLAEGTYYLKETKAPAGYSINGHVYKLEIAPTYNKDTKVLESWKLIVDGKEATEKESAFTVTQAGVNSEINTTVIPNTKLVSLPSTGGIGTTIFTIGGCAIMILAAALYFATRRKAAK